ncbi:hypothetical protein BHE74_00013965, partial [Ensete ventricosum]
DWLEIDGAEGLYLASREMALAVNGSNVGAAIVKSPSVADICRKMAAKRSESKGSSDGRGRREQQRRWLQLHCNFVAAGGVVAARVWLQ